MDTIKCIICGKAIKGESALVIYRTDGVMFAEAHAAQVPADQDQGWFEIGPDCNRKVQRAGAEGFRRVR